MGWILEGVPWRDQCDCPPMLRLQASDLGLQRTMHRMCRIADSSECIIKYCLFFLMSYCVPDADGSRDQFLQQMVGRMQIV